MQISGCHQLCMQAVLSRAEGMRLHAAALCTQIPQHLMQSSRWVSVTALLHITEAGSFGPCREKELEEQVHAGRTAAAAGLKQARAEAAQARTALGEVGWQRASQPSVPALSATSCALSAHLASPHKVS